MIPQIDRLPAMLADRYRVEREIGAGGMATVYLAEDVRHRRRVALKVLHPELSAVLGTERFLKEIELTASLQHPHILPLFDSGEADGQLYYVMPLVDGETLRARLEREKQLSVADALRIATEVADALQYAHERGIIHRDIKPENVLLQGGHALVADFGIALAVQQAGGQRMTQTGLSLGTPQYMAPEQAMGEKAVDVRADVYALGAVTYEMLAGEPPFTGPTAQAIVARVLTAAPAPIRQTRTTVPSHVEHAVLCALAKLPADRPATAKAFSDALANPAFTTGATTPDVAPAARSARGVSLRLFVAVAALAAASLVTAVWEWRRPPTAAPAPSARFTLELPDSQPFVPRFGTRTLALAPDGSELAYIGTSRGRRMIFKRRLNELTVNEVPGTVNANAVLYSPAGEFAFEAPDRTLTTAPVEGRPSARITENVGRANWGDNDVIVFIRGSSLWRTNSRGNPVTRLTTVDSAAGEGDTWPWVLPGGRGVVFNHYRESRIAGEMDVFVVRIADGVIKRLDIKGSNPHFVASGHLLVTQTDGTLLAAPFDLQALELRGPPVRVLQGIYVRSTGAALYDVSRNGTLVYVEGGESNHPLLVAKDGHEQDLGFSPAVYAHPRLSPNGDRVVVERSDGPRSDIWILTRATGQTVRLTRDGRSSSPEWSADGQRVGWIHSDSIGASIRWQRADASGTPEVIPLPGQVPFRFLFARDNKSIVAVVGGPFRHDILLFPIDGESKPRTLASSEADELQPAISPDGRWLAYTSNETGQTEVFVVGVDDPSTRLQVTTDGGNEPVWRGGVGHTLIVRSAASFVSFTLRATSGIEVTRRDTLFADPYQHASPDRGVDASVRTDDFVVLARAGSKRDRIVVVTGWLDELRQRMASTRP